MTSATLEAFDQVSWSEGLLGRLKAAFAELARKSGFGEEKEWLGSAIERLAAAREGVADLLPRAMQLEELAGLREEWAKGLQQTAVDALERLQAGVTFHSGARSPLFEALFAKVKLPALRRAAPADLEKALADFEKRLSAGYVKRMLANEQLEAIRAAVEQARAAFDGWRRALTPAPVSESEAETLREELASHAARLEVPLRQARLLAEAALTPVKGAFEVSGIGARPKRRAPRAAEPPAVPVEPAPTPAEPKAAPPRKKRRS